MPDLSRFILPAPAFLLAAVLTIPLLLMAFVDSVLNDEVVASAVAGIPPQAGVSDRIAAALASKAVRCTETDLRGHATVECELVAAEAAP